MRVLCQTLFGLLTLLACTGAWAAPSPLQSMTSWSSYGQGYRSDAQVSHHSAPSLRCQNLTHGLTSGAFVTYRPRRSCAAPIVITGWSRAENVDGVTDNDYSIYVDVTYADGSFLWGQAAPFETDSHDWQPERLTLFLSKPVRSLNIYALLRNHTGTAWFAGFEAHEMTSNTLFDSQEIAPPVLPKGTESGWFVRDVAAGTPLCALSPGHAALGLRLSSLKAASGGRILQGTLRNLTPQDRAVTVYYVERFGAARPVWWNSIREGIAATEPREYANLVQAGVGATGQLSLYPFGCVTGAGSGGALGSGGGLSSGRALGLPPSLGPRVFRIMFRPDTRLLFLATDLALTPYGDSAHHDDAPVAVARYAVNPAWGFRDAAAQFYALFPAAFQRRAKAEGIWMPFTAPSTIPYVRDFHVAYHEGDNSVAADRSTRILSFKYVEPMTYWMPMTKDTPRTYAAALAEVTAQAQQAEEPGRRRLDELSARQSQAVLSSGGQDARGQFNVAFRATPWCDGAVWVLNPGPRLDHSSGCWTKAQLNSAGEPIPGKPNQPDGEYLDSLEAWADVLDYRPESLTASAAPLCFAPGRFRPCLPTWFSVYASASALSESLHRHGKLLMANSVPWRFTAFAPLLDVMGTETNMFTNAGAWSPEPDAVMDLRRTASYHKPYLLLNTDFRKVSSAKIRLCFERCLFYGIFPSMFSANAADHPYWENPALYNRDRPLFRADIPVVMRLSAAGWEPVTWARSSNPAVWLERFGTSYLTVLNSRDAPVNTVVRIDAARFFPAARTGAVLAVRDVLSGQDLCQAPLKTAGAVRLTLQGGQTRVLSLRLINRGKGTLR